MKTNFKSRRGVKSPRGNNVQKAILRPLAVVISFLLVSYSLSAQDFWKKLLTNSSFNEIAMAMVKTSENPGNSASEREIRNTLTSTRESALKLEAWMLNADHFGGLFSLEKEVNIPLADKLQDPTHGIAAEETLPEEPLEMESWMTSNRCWEI